MPAIAEGRPAPKKAAKPTSEERDALDVWSRTAILTDQAKVLPSGVRYVDLLDGDGPVPAKGQRLYTHFKVWTGGFREGEPRDSSFRQARVYEWNLGTPTDRLVAGADEVALRSELKK